mmetsp:Transcript_83721/g.187283  ORF Transcript_83721/g.187283 Transcript_83721/m.187283 type:complete len:245 (-) Transcript_83721:46-780(-)
MLVHIDAANAVGVAEHWNPSVILDRPHQRIGAPRDHKIDVLVQFQQLRYLRARVDGLHATLGQADLLEGCRHSRDEGRIGALRLLPALQQQGVPGLHGKAGDLHCRVRPRLKDDQQDADWASHTVEIKTFRHLVCVSDLAHRVRQPADVVDASQEAVELGPSHVQPFCERGGERALSHRSLRIGLILLVGELNLGPALQQVALERLEGGILCCDGGGRQGLRCSASPLSRFLHPPLSGAGGGGG